MKLKSVNGRVDGLNFSGSAAWVREQVPYPVQALARKNTITRIKSIVKGEVMDQLWRQIDEA
jgi:hypothetical protein